MRYPREHHEPTASIRRFIAAGIDPFVDEWEADAIFPAHEPFKKMGRPGFPGSTQAEEYGGMGLDFSYALAAAEAIGSARVQGVGIGVGMGVVVQSNKATAAPAAACPTPPTPSTPPTPPTLPTRAEKHPCHCTPRP